MRSISIPIAAAALAATLALTAASTASATVTFGTASLDAYVDPYGTEPSQSGTSTANTLPPTALSQDISAQAPNEGKGFAKGSATFTDAANGLVTIDKLSASGHYGYSPNYAGASGAAVSLNLNYTFTVDTSYLARITYDVAYTGEAVHEVAAGYQIFNSANMVVASHYFINDGVGVIFSDPFGPGTYKLRIGGSGALAATDLHPSKTNTVIGDLGFTLIQNGRGPASPTPEPATWAMLVGGFGLMGCGLRQRRRCAAAAT